MAAKTLDIPISMIKVKPTNGVIGPNDFATAASITSELNCLVSECVPGYMHVGVVIW